MAELEVVLMDEILRLYSTDFSSEIPEVSKKVAEVLRQPKRLAYAVIAKGLDRWTSEDDIKAELQEQGFHGVLLVDRFKREGRAMPLCRIEFETEKEARSLLDNGLRVGHARFRLEEPRAKPKLLQCYKCQAFGHRQATCKAATKKCLACGGDTHTERGEKCDRQLCCPNCQGPHLALYKGCPAYKRAAAEVKPEGQTEARAKRTRNDVSYANAVVPIDQHRTTPQSEHQNTETTSKREEELCSKLAGLIVGILSELFRTGFMLNKDPTRIQADASEDIMDIVSTQTRKHMGMSINSRQLAAMAGLPTTKPANIRPVTPSEDFSESGMETSKLEPPNVANNHVNPQCL